MTDEELQQVISHLKKKGVKLIDILRLYDCEYDEKELPLPFIPHNDDVLTDCINELCAVKPVNKPKAKTKIHSPIACADTTPEPSTPSAKIYTVKDILSELKINNEILSEFIEDGLIPEKDCKKGWYEKSFRSVKRLAKTLNRR